MQRKTAEQAAELAAWRTIFEEGFPHCRNKVSRLTVDIVDGPGADLAVAKAVWRRVGARHLATRDPAAAAPWALRQFGQPQGDY